MKSNATARKLKRVKRLRRRAMLNNIAGCIVCGLFGVLLAAGFFYSYGMSPMP